MAGLPALCSDLPEMRHLVETTGAGSVMDATRPESMAEALAAMMQNGQPIKLSHEVRTAVIEAYGWPAQARKLSELYERL